MSFYVVEISATHRATKIKYLLEFVCTATDAKNAFDKVIAYHDLSSIDIKKWTAVDRDTPLCIKIKNI